MSAPAAYRTHADLGGKPGFGPIAPEADEPLFHAPWEPRTLALVLAMGATGQWNIDLSRAARETLPTYLQQSYYEIWANALAKLLQERGLVDEAELACGQALHPAKPLSAILRPAEVAAVLAKGSPTLRPRAQAARFALGDRVRTVPAARAGHTRLPGYVQGKVGIVTHLHGAHIYADRHAAKSSAPFDTAPEWLYGVTFEGDTLWGPDAEPGSQVCVDIWEPHLQALA
jgi:nitrile hydratase subunit beta